MSELTRRGLALVAALPLALGAIWLPTAARGQAQPLEKAVDAQVGVDRDARASQRRVDQLDDETQKMLAEYRRAIGDAESYATYAAQLEVQVASQREEIDEINRQLEEIETTSREVLPLMQNMLETLDQFVALDVPFLLEERRGRVTRLQEMMPRADVALSEKYRRIVEAYQVEMDYGRTIEAYEGALPGESGEPRTVQFLRVGRVTLLYQTLDGQETGYWDVGRRAWVVDDHYAHAFREGVAVAKKTRAPEMLVVPVPAPTEARS